MANTLEQPATGREQRVDQIEVIRRDPELMSGRPCLPGTRVPVRSLFDHLRHGRTLDSFIEYFPTVSREQADAVLLHACGVLGLHSTGDYEPPSQGYRSERLRTLPATEAPRR